MVEPPATPRDVAEALEALARRLRATHGWERAPPRGLAVAPAAAPAPPLPGAPVEEPPQLDALDVHNDGRHVTITLEARGVDASAVHVSLTETRLLIGLGEGPDAVRRDLPLPAAVESEGAIATFRNGVLDIVLPLRRGAPARTR